MDSDAKFWLILWLGLGLLLCVGIVGTTAVTQYHMKVGYETVERLIAGGTDPIGAQCAVWGRADANDISCELRASAGGRQQSPAPRN